MKKLKILRCNDEMMWYSKKIGENVPFVEENTKEYLSREDAGYINIVKKEDAIIVNEDES